MMECQLFKRVSIAAACAAAMMLCANRVSTAQENASNLAPRMSNDRGEEIVRRITGFSAVVTLDNAKLDSLLQTGNLEVGIPPQLVNSIDSVIIKRPIYFKEKKASGFADAELQGTGLAVAIDDSVIERIDYQPVELRVYEAGFSKVILKYVGITGQRISLEGIGDPKTDSPFLTVKLKSGKGIAGRIRGMQAMNLDSTLGQISVAFSKTTKILVGKKGELNIEMTNGDLISGTIDGGKIELLNRWDNETIDLADVAALIVDRPKINKTPTTQATQRGAVLPAGAILGRQPVWPAQRTRGFHQ